MIEEMHTWWARPLEKVYAAIFIDAIMVKIRDGQVRDRPVYAAIGVDLDGHEDVLGMWAGDGDGKSAKFWLAVLTELRGRGVKDVLPPRRRGPRALPERAAGNKTLYLVTRSLDLKGTGQTRWGMRGKPALNAFAITFADRMPAVQDR